MKKINKTIISLALLFVLIIPIFVSGCFGGNKEKIEILSEFRTEYGIGEQVDVVNGKLQYTDESGNKTPVVITSDMISGFDSSTVGNKTMIVSYEGNSILVEYTVARYDIELNTVYYHANSVMGNSGNDYVKFTNQNTLLISTGYSPNFDNPIFTVEVSKGMENNRIAYTGYVEQGGVEFLLTVVNKNTINLYFGTPSLPGNEATFDLVKLV